MKTQTAMQTHTRWIVRVDMPSVLEIDRDSFDEWWTEHEFKEQLKGTYCIGMVAVRGEKVVGYMVYYLVKERIELVRLAVHPEHRRQGIGRTMLDRLVAKLSLQRRKEAWFEVPEEFLPAQLWLRACGWRCEQIVESAACEGNFYRFVKGAN